MNIPDGYKYVLVADSKGFSVEVYKDDELVTSTVLGRKQSETVMRWIADAFLIGWIGVDTRAAQRLWAKQLDQYRPEDDSP